MRLIQRLLAAVVGVVDGRQLNGAEMRRAAGGGVEVRLPGPVTLVDRETNLGHRLPAGWVGVVDVGHMWTELEVFDPLHPTRRRYLGSGHSYSTGSTYLNLARD